MAITKRSLADSDPFLNLMFVADPGVGKSTAAMTMAKLDLPGRIFVLDMDSLMSEVALKAMGIPVDRVDMFSLDNFDDARNFALQMKKKLEAEPGSIAGVVLDTATEFSRKLTSDLALARARRQGNLEKQFDIDVKEHGQVVEQLRWFCRFIRDLPCHVAFTAHPKEDKEADGTVYYRPAFGPKFATDIYKFCHAVVMMDTELEDGRLNRVGYTNPVGKYRGKDNLNCLPLKMIEPSFERVWQVVNGQLSTAEVDADRGR